MGLSECFLEIIRIFIIWMNLSSLLLGKTILTCRTIGVMYWKWAGKNRFPERNQQFLPAFKINFFFLWKFFIVCASCKYPLVCEVLLFVYLVHTWLFLLCSNLYVIISVNLQLLSASFTFLRQNAVNPWGNICLRELFHSSYSAEEGSLCYKDNVLS